MQLRQMQLRQILLFAFCFFAAATSIAQIPSQYAFQAINVSGVWRSYYLRAPVIPPLEGARVVIMLHGHGDYAWNIIGDSTSTGRPYSKWLPIAIDEKLVLIVPQGLVGSDGEPGWNDCRVDTGNPNSDDVSFLMALLDDVENLGVNINRNRVYVTGTSNGGHMALRMAIERPNDVAAVAAVVAAMPDPDHSDCTQPTIPVPVAIMNGTADPFVPYTGGPMNPSTRGTVLSAADSINVWKTLHGISGWPAFSSFSDTATSDGCTVDLFKYPAVGIPKLLLYRVNDGGHAEPTVDERYTALVLGALGPQNSDIEMAEEIWNFFKLQ